MQRLRRLCGAHQQCVAYSSPELASEISSIVHAAKHHSLSESSSGSSSSHRHHHCNKLHCSKRQRSERSSSRSSSSQKPSNSNSTSTSSQPSANTKAGASIDSFTTHGPGIFSGTFSGSLHPNIQDTDGRPKRDPQTILQILTDLLSATNKYQGNVGDIGLLPQLLKDHFAKQGVTTGSAFQQATSNNKPSKSSSTSSSRRHNHQSHSSKSSSGGHSSNRVRSYSSKHHHQSSNQIHQQQQQLYTQQNFPYSSWPHHSSMPYYHPLIASQPSTSPSSSGNMFPYNAVPTSGIVYRNCGHHTRKCTHRQSKHHIQMMGNIRPYACCCCAAGSTRRSSKHPHINVASIAQKQEENSTTRSKMNHLKMMLKLRKMQRMQRRKRQQQQSPCRMTMDCQDKSVITNDESELNNTAADRSLSPTPEMTMEEMQKG